MTMKAGIITFHTAINFGAVLQSVALHKFLLKINLDNEIIDYENDAFKRNYSPIQKGNNSIKNVIRFIFVTPKQRRKNEQFRDFITSNTKLSEHCSKEELRNIAKSYDLIITGSDQVFKSDLTDFDMSYFLDFVNETTKKCSYAASFGGFGLSLEHESAELELLRTFNRLSIREKTGVDYLNRHGIKSIQNVDPTLLLSSDDWKKLSNAPKDEDYILLYTLGKGQHVEKTIKSANELAKRCKKKILYLNDSFRISTDFKFIRYSSPELFIGLFSNASTVVTNSFHGTAFSIIFHKEFYTNFNMPENKGTRIESLLKLTGIEQNDFDYAIMHRNSLYIDWAEVDRRLDVERKNAEEYFKTIIENI